MMDLFERASEEYRSRVAPLADRMRPRSLDEVVGQEHLVGPDAVLRRAVEAGELHSMILWGPPGSGKTTLAFLLGEVAGAEFVAFSAVLSGLKEIRQVIAEAAERLSGKRKRTILFVDEIHRFNRAQQDAFLPHVEKGTIILIGATTENPSFEVNGALLSRCRVYVLNPLGPSQLTAILHRALDDSRGLGEMSVAVSPEILDLIALLSNGDARSALNILELAVTLCRPDGEGRRVLTQALIQDAAQRKTLLYDKSGEEHYNLISALHKSLRDSDPDGALYWLARMLASGEDPLFIARRLIRFASEDVGNADPSALSLALAAKESYHFLGSPEGELALAQATLYLACAPKSNAVTHAFEQAQEDIRARPTEPVPLHLRNAPTGLMKALGYGKDYQYAHDAPDAMVEQEHLPASLQGRTYYHPTERGVEAEIKKRLDRYRRFISERSRRPKP
jgi:putative ATPase